MGILFGGKSAEHEVSLQSAKNVIDAIDEEKYEVVPIGIDKRGYWHLHDASKFLLHADNPKLIKLNRAARSIALVPGEHTHQLVDLSSHEAERPLDVVFPVLHGPLGEDGAIQGLLKLMDVPFVGAGVLGSAVGMDKDVQKRLLREAGIPTVRFLVFNKSQWLVPEQSRRMVRRTHHRLHQGNPSTSSGNNGKTEINFKKIRSQLGLSVFIKPANLGSSVGIHKVNNERGFTEAVNDAFLYDNKILVEEGVLGREIECSVLGNDNPIASLPGEVKPRHEFYSYEAKYIDENGAVLEIPAKLSKDVVKKIRELAVKTFIVLSLEGMARVDFFLRDGKEVIVNEVNTIPGFTKISMYPKLWEASGIPYPELIDRLIQLALERHGRERELRTSY